jgi:hypothetical protein
VRHLKKINDDYIELTPLEIENLRIKGMYYFSSTTIEVESGKYENVHLLWDDESIAKRKIEEATPIAKPKTFKEEFGEMFNSIPEAQQDEFEMDLIRASFYLDNNNLPKVAKIIGQVNAKLGPQHKEVKKLIDFATSKLLGGQ